MMQQTKIYMPRTKSERIKLRQTQKLRWQSIGEIYAASTGLADWEKIHQARHWKSGYSAKELAIAWRKADPNLPKEITNLFDSNAKLLIATPEHATRLRPFNKA